MFTKKINEIQKVKQNLRDQNSNDLQLSLQNWKDVYDAFKSLVVLEQDISFGTVPPQITVSSLETLAEYDIQKMEQSQKTVKSFHKSIFGQTSVPKQEEQPLLQKIIQESSESNLILEGFQLSNIRHF